MGTIQEGFQSLEMREWVAGEESEGTLGAERDGALSGKRGWAPRTGWSSLVSSR